MAIRESQVDRKSVRAPFAASLAAQIGDLLYWDNSAKFAKPAANRTDTGSAAGNQADFTPLFFGIASEQRLATETDVTVVASAANGKSDRVVSLEGVYDCDCSSATFEVGDLVGIARDATNSVNLNQLVVGVANASLAVGRVIQRAPSAVTKVRCWLSAIEFGWWNSVGPGIVGYTVGQGGAVTQATSKSTGVTLNKLSGEITLNNAALATVTAVSFTLTNSQIAATDTVVVSHGSGGTAGAYLVCCTAVAAGSCKITVYNVTGGSLSEAIVLNYAVIKGAAS